MELAGEHLQNGHGKRQPARCSPANPILLVLTSKASLSAQNPDLGVDIAKIQNLGLHKNVIPSNVDVEYGRMPSNPDFCWFGGLL